MKLKGISPLEQNVDRIVLGVTSLVLAGAVAYQFFGGGNLVKVGTEQVPAPQAFDPVVKAANALSVALDAKSPKIPDAPAFTLTNKLVIGAASPKLAKVSTSLGRAPSISGKVNIGVASDQIAALSVPAPSSPIASMFQSTISPVEQARVAGLAKVLKPEQPFDKAAVSIEASFSGAALREELQKDPDGDGPIQPMPRSWWEDQGLSQVEIIAVEVERETLQLSDGTTPAQPIITKLPTPPGRVAMRAAWDESVRALGDMPGMVVTVREAGEEVQRPKYYDTIAGPEWKPPDESVLAGNQNSKLAQINAGTKELAALDKEIEKVQALYDKAPEPKKPGDKTAEPPRGGSESGGGGGRGGKGASAPSPGGAHQGPKPDEPHGDKVVLGQKLNQLKAERAKVAKKLTDLGVKVAGYDAAAPGMPNAPGAATPALTFLDNPNIKVWSHDLAAEPGAVYRYHVRVVVNNPMYGRNLKAEQAALATNSLIESPWSEWTAPVSIDRPEYFFITSADESSPPITMSPAAIADMYVFYYGYYRQARVSLTPGDALVGEAKLPELKLANMDKIKALVGGAAPAGGPQAPVVPPPPTVPVPEGSKGRRPGAVAPNPGERDRQPPAPGNPVDPGAVGPDWLDTPAPSKLTLKVDAVFLDAATVAMTTTDIVGTKVRSEALLRDGLGNILVKFPDEDKAGEVYKRVDESAKVGVNQGKPVIKAIEPDKVPGLPPKGVTPPPPPKPPRPASGGGGGGGGGGG